MNLVIENGAAYHFDLSKNSELVLVFASKSSRDLKIAAVPFTS